MHSFSTYGHHCSTLDYSVGSGSEDIVSAMQNYSEKDFFFLAIHHYETYPYGAMFLFLKKVVELREKGVMEIRSICSG